MNPPSKPEAESFEEVGVLVTGASGFIGSHLVDALVRAGAKVRALTQYHAQFTLGLLEDLPAEVLAEVEIVRGNVRDPHFLQDTVREDDIVFHLAAQTSIPYSYRSPREFFETNLLGTVNLLEAVRRNGARRLVQTSTSEVYGSAQTVPMDEQHPLVGQSPYAASKIAADKAAESYWRSFETPVVTARPFNTYGPRQSARAIIPSLLSQALAAGPIRVGALHPIRDLNFVDDTVRGFMAVGSAPSAEGGVFNLGSGRGTRIGDLVEMVADLCGGGIEIIQEEVRLRPDASEVDELVCDASLAAECLGWKSEVPLEEGLERTADWVRAHPEHFEVAAYHD